ncbi:MAG: Ig-like domain-containing protein [Deltaproteobacteria bacterium]|nr:Ig-like domain-containing protein [Deltaproteobacteria bacterium]
MKKGYFRYGLALVLIACLFAFPIGCGSPSDRVEDGGGEPEPTPPIEIPDVEEPIESEADSVNLSVDPTTINVEGTATVTATARDSDNNPVEDGTTVVFVVENPAFGTVTESSTTSAGSATATFTAANSPGTATIIGVSGSATGNASVDILQVPAAAIQFVSANPDVIALAGTGGAEISELQFRVLDSNNNPLEGINVTFTMVGPNGGEYIDPVAASTNASGITIVRLYSGSVAGPVTVSATTDIGDPPTPTTVPSTVVSIGGGVPSDKHFSVASTKLNLPGCIWNGKEFQVSAWLADRFGSYNILQGTTVSFGTEVGLATDTASVTLDDTGVATVTVRTQAGAGGAHAEDVWPQPWELALQAYATADYAWTPGTHPTDYVVSVMVYTKGEEHFDDLNANGVYDSGTDLFLTGPYPIPDYDTAEDPFYDYDDDGLYNNGSTYPLGGPPWNPAEIYIDSTPSNGVWDGPDGVWSADTHLFRNHRILLSGSPSIRVATADWPFDVADDDSEVVRLLICDGNFNIPIGGTTVDITSNVGGLAGTLSRIYTDSNAVGPDLAGHLGLIEYNLLVYDTNPGDADPPVFGEITVTLVWAPEDEAELTLTLTIPGQVD